MGRDSISTSGSLASSPLRWDRRFFFVLLMSSINSWYRFPRPVLELLLSSPMVSAGSNLLLAVLPSAVSLAQEEEEEFLLPPTLRFTGSGAGGRGTCGIPEGLCWGDWGASTSLVPARRRWGEEGEEPWAPSTTAWEPVTCCTGDRRTQSPGFWTRPGRPESTRLPGEERTNPVWGESKTGTPPLRLKDAGKPRAEPVLVRLRDTGDEDKEVTGKDVAVLEAGEERLTGRGVLVMVIALFPTLMGSCPAPRRRSTSCPEGGELTTVSCFLAPLCLMEVGDTVGEDWEDLDRAGGRPAVIGSVGVTLPFNKSFLRLS